MGEGGGLIIVDWETRLYRTICVAFRLNCLLKLQQWGTMTIFYWYAYATGSEIDRYLLLYINGQIVINDKDSLQSYSMLVILQQQCIIFDYILRRRWIFLTFFLVVPGEIFYGGSTKFTFGVYLCTKYIITRNLSHVMVPIINFFIRTHWCMINRAT